MEDLSIQDLREFEDMLDVHDIEMDDPSKVIDTLLKAFEKDGRDVEGKDYIVSILKHLLIIAGMTSGKSR